ncbi:Major Facilitator Superfamily protein [Kaistia soli DSM 19436]|uniref:Major Facilitator Superfamily protein n=1 Tax=Kaistia soli DSM 19436 TaxID=1122133 RepID=A0A1M5A529_9HYPH|nr:MFS transporter [Kaistia soli]SHF25361.1 Major Facilitator Superfamily protein [Kaistia soli DSM 19436]
MQDTTSRRTAERLSPEGAADGDPPRAATSESLFSGANGIYAAALTGGVVLHAINIFLTATVMPSVVTDIGGLDVYAWATTLFVVASILAAAMTAKLLRGLGPRGAYLVAALFFGSGTLISALAPSMPVMLVGRSIQGIGGGFLYALAYAVTRIVLPQPLWGRAIGLISATFGVATLIGPAIGGVFAEYGAWRAAFWSLLPFVALFSLLAATKLPGKSATSGETAPIAWLQLILLAAAVLVVSASSLSTDRLLNIAGLAVAILLTALIGRAERGAGARLLPKGSFSLSSPLGVVYLTIALLMMAMQPDIFVPYLLQTLHGQSPVLAGYFAALMALGWTAGTASSVRLRRGDGGRLILAGLLLVLVGIVLFGVFMPVKSDGALLIVTPVGVALFLMGFGIGMAWPCLVTRVYQYAPEAEQDVASGGMTTVQLFAGALGAATGGMIANLAGFADPGGAVGATSAAFWLAAGSAVAPALAIILVLRIAHLAAGKANRAEAPAT